MAANEPRFIIETSIKSHEKLNVAINQVSNANATLRNGKVYISINDFVRSLPNTKTSTRGYYDFTASAHDEVITSLYREIKITFSRKGNTLELEVKRVNVDAAEGIVYRDSDLLHNHQIEKWGHISGPIAPPHVFIELDYICDAARKVGFEVTVRLSESPGDVRIVATAAKVRETPGGGEKEGYSQRVGAVLKIVPSSSPVIATLPNGIEYTWLHIIHLGANGPEQGWVAEHLLETPPAVANHNYKYHWEKPGLLSSAHVTPAFMVKTAAIAKALQIDPDDVMAVMAFESWFDPAMENAAGSSAVGLIQFISDTAKELNTTSADLINMTGVEQLDYVYGYFLKIISREGNLNNLGDVYMAVLNSNGIGKPDSHILWNKYSSVEKERDDYDDNKGLDIDDNGEITRGEATQKVITRRNLYGLK